MAFTLQSNLPGMCPWMCLIGKRNSSVALRQKLSQIPLLASNPLHGHPPHGLKESSGPIDMNEGAEFFHQVLLFC